MFSADKESNILYCEIILLTYVISFLFKDIILCLITLIPSKYIIFYLSLVVLIAICLIIFNKISNYSLINLFIFSTCLFLLADLCICNNPSYIPKIIRYVGIAVSVFYSLSLISNLKSQNQWYYIYQFALINEIKYLIYIKCIILFIDIINSAAYNPLYLLFVFSIFLIILLIQKCSKMNNKVFYLLFIILLILICSYSYFIYGNIIMYLDFIFLLPIIFLINNKLYKKRTVVILSFIEAFYQVNVIINALKIFSDDTNYLISILGVILNIFSLMALFVKIKQYNISNFFLKYSGEYSKEDIKKQIDDFTNDKKRTGNFLGGGYIKAIEYANSNLGTNFNIDIIRNEARQNDDIFEIVLVKDLPFILSLLRYVYNKLKIHWRIPISILILILYFPMKFTGIHNKIENIYENQNEISTLFEVPYYANQYTIETLEQLSNNEDINKYENFPHYIARIFRNKSNEYIDNNQIDLQIETMLFSLKFNYNYDTLYKLYKIYESNNYYYETIDCIDDLLKFQESDKNYLLEVKSIISQEHGCYNISLDTAELIYTEYPSLENNAWRASCLIGIGKIDEAIDILNACIEEDNNLPYWVYRMRGIAYLTLIENGEINYLDNAKADIIFAYNGDKENYKNILAYARLCLYLNLNTQAKKLIDDTMIKESNGQTYYWLSRYYNNIQDTENEKNALDKSRELNYMGNGEY